MTATKSPGELAEELDQDLAGKGITATFSTTDGAELVAIGATGKQSELSGMPRRSGPRVDGETYTIFDLTFSGGVLDLSTTRDKDLLDRLRVGGTFRLEVTDSVKAKTFTTRTIDKLDTHVLVVKLKVDSVDAG